MQKQTFLWNHLGHSCSLDVFHGGSVFAMKFWHVMLWTAPLYVPLEILRRREKAKCPLCSERLAENDPCVQQNGSSSEKVNAARARGTVNSTVTFCRLRLLHPSSSLIVQPSHTFSLFPLLHLQHTAPTNIPCMFFLKKSWLLAEFYASSTTIL